MKLYEKFGIDLTTKEGLLKAMVFCPKKSEKYPYAGCPKDEKGAIIDCGPCVCDYLMKDVITRKVKRYETYNGDFEKACYDHEKCCEDLCVERSCELCFAHWLMEDIEVE